MIEEFRADLKRIVPSYVGDVNVPTCIHQIVNALDSILMKKAVRRKEIT